MSPLSTALCVRAPTGSELTSKPSAATFALVDLHTYLASHSRMWSVPQNCGGLGQRAPHLLLHMLHSQPEQIPLVSHQPLLEVLSPFVGLSGDTGLDVHPVDVTFVADPGCVGIMATEPAVEAVLSWAGELVLDGR